MKKILLAVVITFIITLTITVSAYSYLAKDIKYTPKDKNWKVDNIEDALNDLKSNNQVTYETWSTGLFTTSRSGIAKTKDIKVPEGVKKVTIYISISSTYGVMPPSVTGNILVNQTVTEKSETFVSYQYASGFYEIVAYTSGEAGTITLNVAIPEAADGNSSDAIVLFQ